MCKNRFHLPGNICTFSTTKLNQYQNQDPTKITCLISTKSTQTRIFSDHNSVWYLIRTIGVSMAIFIDLVFLAISSLEKGPLSPKWLVLNWKPVYIIHLYHAEMWFITLKHLNCWFWKMAFPWHGYFWCFTL